VQTKVFDLPSSLKLETRGLTLAEENILASADRRGDDEILDRVFASCWKGTVDPGPYKLGQNNQPPWSDLIQGDRFVHMLFLRTLSYTNGHLYEIEVYHEDCGTRFPWQVDLLKDMPIRMLNEDAIERVRTGTPFETSIDGRVVKFKIPTVKEAKFTEKLQEQFPERMMAAMLRARLVEVEGVEKRDLMDWLDGNNGVSEKYPGLTSEQGEELRDAYDLVDGGIDTDVEVVCTKPTCRQAFLHAVPFGRRFLLPSKGIEARKRARRLGMGSSGD